MASEQGGESSFNFGCDEFYSDTVLAEQVIWPMVSLAKGVPDWRKDSQFGETPLHYSRHDVREGRTVSAALVGRRFDYWADNKPKTGHIAQLIIAECFERPDDEAAFDLIMNGAKAYVVEQYGRLSSATNENDESAWPGGTEELFEVGVEQIYIFDEIGLVDTEFSRIVKGANATRRYPFDTKNNAFRGGRSSDDVSSGPGFRLRAAHIATVETACDILDPPQDVHEALRHLKAHPAEVY